MKVIVAQSSGFCHGVENAISIAEKVLQKKGRVYSLGPIIHNEDMVRRLSRRGLETINSVEEVEAGTVIIRSHGAAPEEVARLRKKGLRIVDATCVLVKRVQKIARQLEAEGYGVVIVGDKEHPEVRAVVGCVREAYVVGEEEDLHKLPLNKKLGVVCQTTQGAEYFGGIVGQMVKMGVGELKVMNTLCREARKRQQSAVELCRKVDIMFVLGGLDSANTRELARMCKKYNRRTYHLQNWKEFDKRMVLGKKTAGVTAGASTPRWVIDEFVKKLRATGKSKN